MLLAKAQATAAADDRQLGGYTKLKKLGVGTYIYLPYCLYVYTGYRPKRLLSPGGCGTVWQVATTETATSPERDLFALKQIPKGALCPFVGWSHDHVFVFAGDGAVVSGVVEARVGLKLFPTAAVVRDKLLQGLRHHDVATPPLAATVSLSQLKATIVDGSINKEQAIILDYRPDENPPLEPSPPPSAPVNIPMYIVPLLAVVETKQDLWLVFEQGGETLHNALFDIRGEFLHGSRSYVPPDILELLRTKHQTNHVKAYLDAHSRPHSFDMWSLGCVFLEIACGVPLWLPFKARVALKYRDDKKPLVTGGLLAATGRNADKIATRQLHVVANLRKCIRECGGMNVDSRRWVHGVDLMQRMLEIDPAQRISPTQALAHPFLASGTVVSSPPHGLTTGQGQNAPHPVNTDVATFSLR
ncbi:hypothetical protein DYB36_001385 [Aphanomyces astaci]|uniref:Protein kinase domain-containing protein n=1 Tax=Aphanomyces astaci TaxID=112090 RepID=A0A397FCM8_APHAT|nr:hypothetical protein DYB36_001385 [Aphanomyces astaci]RHZ26869.1 hypothetical protein DYB31_005315 [Aphanomyces astaci]